MNNINYTKNIIMVNIFLIIMMMFYNSCSINKMSKNKKSVTENVGISSNLNNNENKSSNNIEIELSKNDYQIIEYSETIGTAYNNKEKIIIYTTTKIRKFLKIEIINQEKIIQLKNVIYPIILIELNNKTYYVKGHYAFLSSVPWNTYFFIIDGDGKIMNFENNIITFVEYDL
jgi:hypothetical protein